LHSAQLRTVILPHALLLLLLLPLPVQVGQSHFFKLPGGKLKPDEDGESREQQLSALKTSGHQHCSHALLAIAVTLRMAACFMCCFMSQHESA
jgi:hypothetical protein